MCACAFARVASQHTFMTTNSGFSPPHITFVDANAVLAVLKVALRIPLLAAPGLSVVASSTVKS